MRGVRHRPALLLSLLFYVTLDLSLPAMPGAFVFDLADSVEGVRSRRARTVTDVVVMPEAMAGAVVRWTPPAEGKARVIAPGEVERAGPPARPWSFVAHIGPHPPSEDPH